jgi:hypothetical protein
MARTGCGLRGTDLRATKVAVGLLGDEMEECQLCKSGCPKFPGWLEHGVSTHLVSWPPGTAALIPCSTRDREKLEEIDKRLAEAESPKK